MKLHRRNEVKGCTYHNLAHSVLPHMILRPLEVSNFVPSSSAAAFVGSLTEQCSIPIALMQNQHQHSDCEIVPAVPLTVILILPPSWVEEIVIASWLHSLSAGFDAESR